MENNLIFCLSFILFCSCGGQPSATHLMNEKAHFVISLDEAIEDNEFSFEKFNGSFKFIQLETISESLLTDIRFVGLLNDTIVIVDEAYQIMSFSNTGKYIGRIGRNGGGPNEYRGIKSFSFDRKLGHALVVDFASRVLRYDLAGNLITYYNLSNEVMNTSEDNSLFSNNYFFNYYQASVSNPYAHSYYGINDTMKYEFLNPNPMYKCVASKWSVNPLTQLNDTIVFVKPLSDTIFQFTNGNITPRYVFRHKAPSLSPEKIDFYNNSEKEKVYHVYLSEQQQNGYFVGIQDIFETKNFLIFSLNYVTNYLFDKTNGLLYKIADFKDLGTEDLFSIGKRSGNNSFIIAISPFNIMTKQEIFLETKKEERRSETFRNPPSEYEKLILDFEEENNPIVIIATFGE